MIGAQVISSLKWLASARLAGQAIATVISVIVIRLLEPSDYGLMAMALVFLGLLLLLNEMGLGAALVQQKELGHREIEQVFGLLLVVNVVLYALVFLAAPAIAAFFREPRLVPIIQVLALRLPLISLLVVPRAMLQRNMRFRAKSIVDFLGMITASGATLALAMLGFGVWSLVYGVLIGGLVEVAGIWLAYRAPIRPRFSLHGMRRQAVFGSYLTVDRILWYVYTRSDALIIGRLLGNEALGVYYIAKKFASLPLDLSGGMITQVGFSAYSRTQHDMPALRSRYCKAARLASFLSFPICFGIAAVAPEAVPLILGPKWVDAVLPLQLIALVIPLRQLNVLNTPALLGIGRPGVNVANLAIALVIMPTAFLVGSRWGVPGVAWAWVAAYPIYFAIMLARSLPILGIPGKRYWDAVWPSAAAGAAMFGLVALSRVMLENVGAGVVTVLVFGIMVGATGYFLAMFFLRPATIREFAGLVRR